MSKETAKKWLEWVDSKVKSEGGWDQIDNWEKPFSQYTISGNPTWDEIYDRALANYIQEGGTKEEAVKIAPYMGEKSARKEKADATAKEEAAVEKDPFGVGAVDKYKLTVDVDENGNQSVRGIEPGGTAALPMYIYTGTSTKYKTVPHPGTPSVDMGGDTDVFVTTDYNVIRARILKDAQLSQGGLDSLFTKLYQSGVISKKTFDAKNINAPEFDKGLQYLVNQYSIAAVNNYSALGNKEVKTFNDFMATDFKGSGKTSKTTYDMVITTRQDASEEINQFFMQYLGRPATKDEHDEYYKSLNGAEKKAVRYTTITEEGNRTTKGEMLSDTDRALIMGKVAGSAIKGTDIDTLMKAGGGAAQDVDTILAHAREYGVKVSREQATKYVAENLRNGSNTDATKAKIVEISRSNYKGLADKISDKVSVKELAGNYIYNKADVLELNPETIDLFDADIQDAINGNVTMTDFNVRLRQNAGWAKTKNAKEEAAKYATTILESFGLQA